jgi:hypothetical protein
VDVYNGGTTFGLAADVSGALVAKGYRAGVVTNASAQPETPAAGAEIFYGAGTSANAAKIASYLGATATALLSLKAGHVEVLLGTASTVVPASPAPAAATASRGPAASAGDNGASGGAVTVTPNAKYGIPCEY